jgi:hypothetical protein
VAGTPRQVTENQTLMWMGDELANHPDSLGSHSLSESTSWFPARMSEEQSPAFVQTCDELGLIDIS